MEYSSPSSGGGGGGVSGGGDNGFYADESDSGLPVKVMMMMMLLLLLLVLVLLLVPVPVPVLVLMLTLSLTRAGLDYSAVDVSEATFRDVFLPPFAAGVDAGALTLMSAFVAVVGGVPAAGSRWLQTEVRSMLLLLLWIPYSRSM